LIELAGFRGGTIRMLLGTPRREVVRRLGNPMITSILQKAGLIDFDSEGRLIRGAALEQGNGGESGKGKEGELRGEDLTEKVEGEPRDQGVRRDRGERRDQGEPVG
jgi:hypothetical protein